MDQQFGMEGVIFCQQSKASTGDPPNLACMPAWATSYGAVTYDSMMLS